MAVLRVIYVEPGAPGPEASPVDGDAVHDAGSDGAGVPGRELQLLVGVDPEHVV